MATYSEYKTLVKEEVQMYVAQISSKEKEDFSSKVGIKENLIKSLGKIFNLYKTITQNLI